MTNPLEAVALIRLSTSRKALTRSELMHSLKRVVDGVLSQSELRSRLPVVLESLSRASHVEPVGTNRLQVTAEGRQAAQQLLGTHARMTWRKALELISMRGLGLDPKTNPRDARAALVAQSHGLQLEGRPTWARVRDALAWQQLGIQESGSLTKRRLLEHVLSQLVDESAKVDPDRIVPLLAAKAAGSHGASKHAVHRSGLRHFLSNTKKAVAPKPAFAKQVLAAARASAPTARYGADKVFISEVWRRVHTDSPAMSEREFKARLAEANREGELQLSRADLVELMDPALVAQSEVHFNNATFHFVRI